MTKNNALENQVATLEIQSEQQRKANFIKPLALGLVVVHFIALIPQILNASDIINFLINGSGLVLYSAVLLLNKRGQTNLAAYLFCYGFNLLITYYYIDGLRLSDDPNEALLFAYMLSLGILLAGSLISIKAGFLIFALNVGIVFISLALVTNELITTLRFGVPIFAFLLLIMLISWLFQKTLVDSQEKLKRAKQELNQTALMQRDINIARELQEQLYPQPPQSQNGVHFISYLQSARETSGDFYDFVDLGKGKIGIVLGDVTGKSIAAAMLMAMTRSILRTEARRSTSPAEVLSHANQTLLEDAAVEQMVSVFYGVLDTTTYTLTCSNAGQVYPILKRNGTVAELQFNGFPIGSLPEATYNNHTVTLEPGDNLILFTDGICEAMDTQKRLFGFEGINQALLDSDGNNPEHILSTVWNRVETFRGIAKQSDDMAMVIISIQAE